jgi:HTH-type transcriptional regulator/antitoxin HigA
MFEANHVNDVDNSNEDEIELLTLLIENWDQKHASFSELDPVQLLQSFMKTHQLKSKDLVEMLQVSKGYVSDILNYKKGFSKNIIRILANHFKVNQAAFNRPYNLLISKNKEQKHALIPDVI